MTTDQKLEHIKALNRERQRRFYENNKQRVCEKKKADRQELAEFRKNPTPQINEVLTTTEQTIEPTPLPTPKKVLRIRKTKTGWEKVVPPTIYDEKTILEMLNTLEITKNTKITYTTGTKALFHLTNCENLQHCLADFTKIKHLIETGNMKNRTGTYANNSKKGIVQTILFLVDKLNIPISKEVKDEYLILFDVYKLKSKRNTEEKKTNENLTVMTFPQYIEKIGKKFGETSKQYLVANMYSEVSCRDNFNLLIVSNANAVKNDKENYIVVSTNKATSIKIVIRSFKTDKLYENFDLTFSNKVSTLIRNYMKKMKLTYDDKLFEDTNNRLTQVVSEMNKSIGIKEGGGINYFRYMNVSNAVANPNMTDEGMVRLAKSMKHSTDAQQGYIRLTEVKKGKKKNNK